MSNEGKFLFLVVGACFIVSFLQSFIVRDENRQRQIYWSCTAIAVVAGFLAVEPNWREGLVVAGSLFLVMTVNAYVNTPYVKVGGRVRTLGGQDSRPVSVDAGEGSTADPEYDPAPDAYSGFLTAPKMWWLVVFMMVISAINIYAFLTEGDEWVAAAIGLAFLVFMAVVSGLGDASWDYKIARGQYLQFGIATIVTAGSFALLYLAAFLVARRWPLRRKQSMEYRTHPRHWKKTE